MNDFIDKWALVSQILFSSIGVLVFIIGGLIARYTRRYDNRKLELHTEDAQLPDGEQGSKQSQGEIIFEHRPFSQKLFRRYLFKFLMVLLRFLGNTTDDDYIRRKNQIDHDKEIS